MDIDQLMKKIKKTKAGTEKSTTKLKKSMISVGELLGIKSEYLQEIRSRPDIDYSLFTID